MDKIPYTSVPTVDFPCWGALLHLADVYFAPSVGDKTYIDAKHILQNIVSMYRTMGEQHEDAMDFLAFLLGQLENETSSNNNSSLVSPELSLMSKDVREDIVRVDDVEAEEKGIAGEEQAEAEEADTDTDTEGYPLANESKIIQSLFYGTR